MTRDDLFDELKMSVELLLEALDMTVDSSSPLNDAAKVVVAGFFKGEQKRAKLLLQKIKEHKQSAAAAQASADQLR